MQCPMTRADSDWLGAFFTANTRDWTPACERRTVRVLYAPISQDPDATSRCASVLSEAERAKADRYVTQDGSAHFKQRRAFRRYCGSLASGSTRPLSRIDFDVSAKGRPYLAELPELWFSFSSCPHGFVGAWSATHAVGVDIEDQDRRLEPLELAQRYFSSAEAVFLTESDGPVQRRNFFILWCLKEAALKSIGEGLPFGLDAFEFELSLKPRLIHAPCGYGGPKVFRPHVIEENRSCAALIVRDAPLPKEGRSADQ